MATIKLTFPNELTALIAELGHALTETRDALEGMVEQHFGADTDGSLSHDFLSANEDATEVLARYWPDRWEDVGTGLRRKDEGR